MKIKLDSRIRSFPDIEIDNKLPVLRQIISYLDSQNFDTSKAKVVRNGKQINPELRISDSPETPKFYVQWISERIIENPWDIVEPEVQIPPEAQVQPAEIDNGSNINYPEDNIPSKYKSDGEEDSAKSKNQRNTNKETILDTVVDESQNLDMKIARLMDEGYEFEDAYAALQEFDGNYEESIRSLRKKTNPEEQQNEEGVMLNGGITNEDATILGNILRSKDPAIVDMKAKIINNPYYIWEWIDSLKQNQHMEYVEFFTRNAYIFVDLILEDSQSVIEETTKPKEIIKPPRSVPHEGESDSEMSDVSFDSKDSELNEL